VITIEMRGDGLIVDAIDDKLEVSKQSISKWSAAFMKKSINDVMATKRKRLISDAGVRARSLRSLAITVPLDPFPESTHLKSKDIIGRDSKQTMQLYRRRFGIETSYRIAEMARART
jgi:IS4 transposase